MRARECVPAASPGRLPLRAQGQAGHLSAHGRRPAADGPLRLQAGDERVVRQGPARLGPHGPAADHDDLGPEAVSRSPRRSTSSRSTASAACGSASCCPTPPRWSTTCASSAACTPRRSTTSRPSRYMQTGNQITGRPCLGSWVSYGLGSLNDNLPTFVVLVAKPTNTEQVQAISARLWSSGYLSGEHAGVVVPQRRRSDPVHQQPAGRPARGPPRYARRPASAQRDELPAGRRPRDAHPHRAVRTGLPHAVQRARADRHRQRARIDLSRSTATRPRSPARSPTRVLLARRMVERGVRFVQIYHNNWDTHANVAGRLPDQCRDVDQAC